MKKRNIEINKLKLENYKLRREKAELLGIVHSLDLTELKQKDRQIAALTKQVESAVITLQYVVESLENLPRKSDLLRDIITRGKLFLNQIYLFNCYPISEQEQNQKLLERSHL